MFREKSLNERLFQERDVVDSGRVVNRSSNRQYGLEGEVAQHRVVAVVASRVVVSLCCAGSSSSGSSRRSSSVSSGGGGGSGASCCCCCRGMR